MYNNELESTDEVIASINKKNRDEKLGIKKEQPDLNRGRLSVKDVRSFESNGKKIKEVRKREKDNNVIRIIIEAALIVGASALLIAGIKRNFFSNKEADDKSWYVSDENGKKK